MFADELQQVFWKFLVLLDKKSLGHGIYRHYFWLMTSTLLQMKRNRDKSLRDFDKLLNFQSKFLSCFLVNLSLHL